MHQDLPPRGEGNAADDTSIAGIARAGARAIDARARDRGAGLRVAAYAIPATPAIPNTANAIFAVVDIPSEGAVSVVVVIDVPSSAGSEVPSGGGGGG